MARIKPWARALQREAWTLWFATKHPRTPWYAKALGVFVVAYALSPIDLIPDFIPVVGYLDDLILLPGLIWLALRLTPLAVVAECRLSAEKSIQSRAAKPVSGVGAAVIVAIWIAVLVGAWVLWAPGAFR